MSLERGERWFYIAILFLALFTRFYMLGVRAVSHDESIHTVFSWNLYAGLGFKHDPLMHGPLLFEVTALNYFLFGVGDFSARIFPALTGVALVLMPLLFRRWLGRWGAMVASLMLLLSPSISYYSRYIRHDIPLMLSAVLLLWTILRYLESGQPRWLYGIAACFALMYAIKEVAYIYTAIFLLLLTLPFMGQIFTIQWRVLGVFKNVQIPGRRVLYGMGVCILVLGGVFLWAFQRAEVEEVKLEQDGNPDMVNVVVPWWGRIAVGLAFLLGLGVVLVIAQGVGRDKLRSMRLFDVLMVLGTLTLPLGSAFLIKFVAGVEINAFYKAMMARPPAWATLPSVTLWKVGAMVGASLLLSVFLGVWWDAKRWWKIALVYYAVFFMLYSTFFTWGFGVLTGLVGGLMYWMSQQGVTRGDQPWYFYLLLAPLYEYFVLCFAAGTGLYGLGYAFKRTGKLRAAMRRLGYEADRLSFNGDDFVNNTLASAALSLKRGLPLGCLTWALLSWGAYIYAGEKMPWLLVHIILPHVFLAAWGLGQVLERVNWRAVRVKIKIAPVIRWAVLVLAGALAISTVHTMVMLNFVNYDMPTELLIYAHGTPDIKIVLEQIRAISWRTTGTAREIPVAYGQDVAWPFTWYMLKYPNAYFYGTSPEPEALLACPVVIAGKAEWEDVDAIVGDAYVHYDYKHIWFPLQDYRPSDQSPGLTWTKIHDALVDPAMRAALWDIIWRRDYTRYARLKYADTSLTLQDWPGSHRFRLYVRRDLAL